MSYFIKQGVRMRWSDGMEAFCKGCDSERPHNLVDAERALLACCECGRRQSALNVYIARAGADDD